ncbi:MAG TPA: GxxExxY protein [Candidatus Kryptobacter bacterium]|nr:GxxExxY protein [Candidatus Kryptobacter bacterium]
MSLDNSKTENQLSREIIGAALEVHKALGPGLLESAYETSLARELELRRIEFKRQLGLPLIYKDAACDVGYRLDLLVEGKVIIEVKSVEALTDVHVAQVLTYLKLTGCKLGLLINFNVKRLKDGIRRLVNRLDE